MENFYVLIASVVLALLALGFLALMVLAYRQFKSYIHLKGYDTAYAQFLDYAETIIRALEQKGIQFGWDGPRKKELAVIALRRASEFFGLKVPEDMIEQIIEGAVQILNSEAGKFIQGSELETDMDVIRGSAE